MTARSQISLLLTLLAAALVGALLVAWRFGAAAGFALVAAYALGGLAYYASKLTQLSRWLHDPQLGNIPRGFGLWGDAFSGLSRQIRNQRATQKALHDTLSRFQQAAAALPDGTVILDENCHLIWCNPAAEKQLGLSLLRDRSRVITDLIRTPEFIAHIEQRNFDEPLVARFTNTHELTLSLQLVRFGGEQILLVSRDVSERERLEVMRRDFVANVSHELRTPLTVVSGFLETVSNAGTSNAALLEKSLVHMSTQTARMQRLVEDLLTLSRLEDLRNRQPAAPINVPELIHALVVDATHLSAGCHTITHNIKADWLLGNRDELVSAFGNLVTNAVRYTPDGGAIRVEWFRRPNAELVFRVVDNGEGIAPAHLPRLTERFYRVDRGRSRASGGTGLGLAIVKHALLRHDARLEIQSSQQPTDHGTTFTVTFPPKRATPAEST